MKMALQMHQLFQSLQLLRNPNIKPEITTSYELGTDVKLFKGRLNFDIAYYHSISKNQSLEIALPAESGYSRRTLNVGRLENKGVEVVANIALFKK